MVVKTAVEIKEPAILALDKGEREAIALSVSLGAEFLLTDDYKARVVARQLGIATLTTLLILDAAADRGWINFHEAVQRLLETNFRVDPLTIAQLAEKHA
jgi:predicted nucleic acid-binding protein